MRSRSSRAGTGPPWLRRSPALGATLLLLAAVAVRGQSPSPPAPTLPAPEASAVATSPADLVEEMRRLRAEVGEVQALRQEVERLRTQVSQMQGGYAPVGSGLAAPAGVPVVGRGGTPAPRLTTTHSGTSTMTEVSGDPRHPSRDNFPLDASYRYNVGTGTLGGGGYVHLGDEDGEFSFNLTNQITLDGTFYDRQDMPTIEQGFNVPFARTFLYGNITKDWLFQVGTQGFLGQFNLLDLWGAYRVGDYLTVRLGKGLTPPLYEYYAFSPAMEAVITNSPLFQLAGKRQLGVMATGNLFDGRLQYWSGVNNTGTSFWYDLNRDVEYNGAVTFTPFAATDGMFKALGAGVGFSSGYDRYALDPGQQIAFINGAGEPTTNSEFVTSTGIPFYTYKDGIVSNGVRTRVAPHLFWYGRFSVVAEYMSFSRVLSDGATIGRSTQRGYYVNASYFLTGERDFQGNGFQGYATVAPLRPWRPSKGAYGPGAWQLAAQWSELDAGEGDIARGFVDPATSTNRLGQLMAGLNWWPNRYTRLTFNYVWSGLNRPIPINGPDPIDTWGTFWFRYAMFF